MSTEPLTADELTHMRASAGISARFRRTWGSVMKNPHPTAAENHRVRLLDEVERLRADLRTAKAEAWEEGYQTGREDERLKEHPNPRLAEFTDNPYAGDQ